MSHSLYTDFSVFYGNWVQFMDKILGNTEEASTHKGVKSIATNGRCSVVRKKLCRIRKFCCLSTDKASPNLEAMMSYASICIQIVGYGAEHTGDLLFLLLLSLLETERVKCPQTGLDQHCHISIIVDSLY